MDIEDFAFGFFLIFGGILIFALEVLDEITNTIKNRYIVKPSGILTQEDMAKEHKRLNYLYNGEFIMENPPFEIESINSNIIYYEMPKE